MKIDLDFRNLSDRALFGMAAALGDGGKMAKELGILAAGEALARYRGDRTDGCAELILGPDMDPGAMIAALSGEITCLERAAISRNGADREDCTQMAEFLFGVYEQILQLCRLKEAD